MTPEEKILMLETQLQNKDFLIEKLRNIFLKYHAIVDVLATTNERYRNFVTEVIKQQFHKENE